jgi:hypothetical protein
MALRHFANLPALVDTGNPELNKFLAAVRENVELLAGLRGEPSDWAVLKGDIDTAYPDDPIAVDLNTIVSLKETLRKLMVDLKT